MHFLKWFNLGHVDVEKVSVIHKEDGREICTAVWHWAVNCGMGSESWHHGPVFYEHSGSQYWWLPSPLGRLHFLGIILESSWWLLTWQIWLNHQMSLAERTSFPGLWTALFQPTSHLPKCLDDQAHGMCNSIIAIFGIHWDHSYWLPSLLCNVKEENFG